MRSRNIKPGFFENEVLGHLEHSVRLVFVATWVYADRAGRFEDRPTRFRAVAFPYEPSLDVDRALTILQRNGFVCRYASRGKRYVQVLNWTHQRPHSREQHSLIPPPSEADVQRAGADPWGDEVNTGSDKSTTSARPRHVQGDAEASPRCPDSLILRFSDSLIVGLSDCLIVGSSDPLKEDQELLGRDAANASSLVGENADQSTAQHENESESDKPTLKPREVVALYNALLCPPLAKAKSITGERLSRLRARIRNDLPTLEGWRAYFEAVKRRPFLMGEAKPGAGRETPFRADFDFLIREKTMTKIEEGGYA